MPFNSASYYRNKWRQSALKELAEARRLKREGPAVLWTADATRDEAGRHESRIASAVRLARSSWRLYLLQCRICELSRESHNSNRPPQRHRAPYRPQPFSTRESNNA